MKLKRSVPPCVSFIFEMPKKLFYYSILLIIFSCTSTTQNAEETSVPKYLQEDLPFIQEADIICQTIDSESSFVHRKSDTIPDRDGQKYPVLYTGYSKSSSDSVNKFVANVLFGRKNSAKTTVYYHNGTTLKAITEIFADDTVKCAFYYNGDKMIYPQETAMDEAAKKALNQSNSWKTFFLPSK